MKNERIELFDTLSQRLIILTILLVIFSLNITYKYAQFQDFKAENFLKVEAEVINIYHKKSHDIIKFSGSTHKFFTQVPLGLNFEKKRWYSLVILTNKISFIEYLKGFYTTSLLIKPIVKSTLSQELFFKVNSQHEFNSMGELFNALFLAIPLSAKLRDFFANLGLSHLIAISGFHLSVLSLCLYFLISAIYRPLHQRFVPYRNRRFDIMLLTLLMLFGYLLLSGMVASLLRAFIMLCIAILFLRSNIKILSFESLFMTLLLIVSFFPEYLFSLSLWFSVIGVFYIFLFIHYFQNSSKFWMVILFNFWIFAAFNPIVHYFFSNTSYEQLLSPFLTMLFTLFYPFELFLHLIGEGALLDSFLVIFLEYKIEVYERFTPLWFFMIYILVSLISIIKKEAFILLNILLVGYNLYLYLL